MGMILSLGVSKILWIAIVNSTTPKFEAKWPPFSDMVFINQKLDSVFSGIVDSLEEQLKQAGKWEAFSKFKNAKVKRVWMKNGKIVKEDNY